MGTAKNNHAENWQLVAIYGQRNLFRAFGLNVGNRSDALEWLLRHDNRVVFINPHKGYITSYFKRGSGKIKLSRIIQEFGYRAADQIIEKGGVSIPK